MTEAAGTVLLRAGGRPGKLKAVAARERELLPQAACDQRKNVQDVAKVNSSASRGRARER